MEGLSKSFFELDSAINKASLNSQPRPNVEKAPVLSQEPDTYTSKSARKPKNPSMIKTNPIATIGLVIAGAFALIKGKGKIADVLKKIKDSNIGQSAAKLVKPVTDFVKKLPETVKTKFPKVFEKAGKIFKPVSENVHKAWSFIKTKLDDVLPSIKKIFTKKHKII